MKTKILLSVLALGLIVTTCGEKHTMELTFTSENNGQHVPLDSILIENLTQGGYTALYAPDTVLVLEYIISVGDKETFEDKVIGFKSQKSINNFVFNIGDELKYTAYTDVEETELIDYPTGSHFYTFPFDGWTPCHGLSTVTDIDGNTYNTVQIGTQCWMKENLKTTTYQNGTSIPTNNGDWSTIRSGAYAWYDNDLNWKNLYGGLYNWYATVDDNDLCPTGWHVPTNDEWRTLTNFIRGAMGAGKELKSCRQMNSPQGGSCNTTEHPRWNEHSTQYGIDTYGFSGLPGGYRGGGGWCADVGRKGRWWSTTGQDHPLSMALSRLMDVGFNGELEHIDGKEEGFSVRCVRD